MMTPPSMEKKEDSLNLPQAPARGIDRKALKLALKACMPVILGYLPTGFAFGLMLTSAGYSFITALLMSVIIYAGAGQYLAVSFLTTDAALFQIAVMTFLVNSKHLFYGLSLLDDYRRTGLLKPYLVFALTDETYALLTEPNQDQSVDRTKYCFYVSLINQSAWVASTLLGAILGSLAQLNVDGMEFAMTALFIVILIEQLKAYHTKLPFIIGTAGAIIAFLLFGRSNMLLFGTVLSGTAMVLLQRRIEPR